MASTDCAANDPIEWATRRSGRSPWSMLAPYAATWLAKAPESYTRTSKRAARRAAPGGGLVYVGGGFPTIDGAGQSHIAVSEGDVLAEERRRRCVAPRSRTRWRVAEPERPSRS